MLVLNLYVQYSTLHVGKPFSFTGELLSLGELMCQKALFLPSLLLPKVSSSTTLEETLWLNQRSNSAMSGHVICFYLLAVSASRVEPGTGRVDLLLSLAKTTGYLQASLELLVCSILIRSQQPPSSLRLPTLWGGELTTVYPMFFCLHPSLCFLWGFLFGSLISST